MTRPDLTVVTMVETQRERCAWALEAIGAQSIVDRMEVLLLDFDQAGQPPVRGSDRPRVRVMRAEKGWGYGRALAVAVHEARAPVIAFVEEHVIVLEGWAQALVDAHAGPWAAVCGEVYPGDLDRPVSQRIELVSRHEWSAPAARGEATVLRWQNVSYKREALLRYANRLPLYLASESALFRQLRADGARLFVEPAARMVHAHEERWRAFLVGSFHSARLGAASAAEIAGARPWQRAALGARHVLGLLRWPWMLWRRTCRLPHADRWRRVFLRNLPSVAVYYGVHALAGALGAIAGAGDSNRSFLTYELNEARRAPSLPTGR